MGFAIPDFEHTKLALTVQLDNSFGGTLNLVILFTEPSEVNWNVVKDLIESPEKLILSADLSTSPWSYRCCDYAVGALLGLVEALTRKTFQEMPNPTKLVDAKVKYYQLTDNE